MSVPVDDCRHRWLELGVGRFTRPDGGRDVRIQSVVSASEGLSVARSVHVACQIAGRLAGRIAGRLAAGRLAAGRLLGRLAERLAASLPMAACCPSPNRTLAHLSKQRPD
jgi:hypothetical protein